MLEIISILTLILILNLYVIVLRKKLRPVSIDEYVRDLKEELVPTVVTPLIDPFLRFPCDCKEQITLEERIFPGQAAVLLCENCKTSWTVYNPSLVVKKTSELPDELQKVWAELADEPL